MAVKQLYQSNPDKKKAASLIYHFKNHNTRLESFRKYRCCKNNLLYIKKARYHLAPPTPILIESKLRIVQANLLSDVEAKSDLIEVFKMMHHGTLHRVSSQMGKTVC